MYGLARPVTSTYKSQKWNSINDSASSNFEQGNEWAVVTRYNSLLAKFDNQNIVESKHKQQKDISHSLQRQI